MSLGGGSVKRIVSSDNTSRALRCALLTPRRWDLPALIILATPGIEFVAFDGRSLGIEDLPNPFDLPVVDTADVALVTSIGYLWLTEEHPDSVDGVFLQLERTTTIVAGFDTVDQCALGFPPRAFDRLAVVLKAHGLFRDRELYNYQAGPLFPGSARTEKVQLLAERYPQEALEKLRLSVPFFARDTPAVRRVIRRYDLGTVRRVLRSELVARNALDVAIRQAQVHAPVGFRPLDVHCVGAMTHVQRLHAMQRLVQFSGARGITTVPEFIGGIEPPGARPGRPGEVSLEVHARFADEAAPFRRAPLNRARFMLELSRHKIGVAPTGWGELTYRHGEVLRIGAALVCESLEHIETQFPFENDHNAVFFRPDLSDLTERIRELLTDERRRRRIARTGRSEFIEWESRWQTHLHMGVLAPLADALGWKARHECDPESVAS